MLFVISYWLSVNYVPELPEVQTIINDLNKKITGFAVADFWSDWPKAIKNKTLSDFKKEITGRKILHTRRIGKNIFIDLSGGKTLYIHLKMTGHLLVKTRANFQFSIFNFQSNSNNKIFKLSKGNHFKDRVNGYIHHAWLLTKGNEKIALEFSDMRKFAKIVLDDTQKISELKEIKKLGMDVMDKKFTLKKFEEILDRKKQRSIGLILMDQELMSGIGNIYRSEILYVAGILPQRRIESLSKSERSKVYRAIFIVLKKAIRLRGTSDSDYRDTFGAPGNFQKVIKVYRRTGKSCGRCDTIVKKMTLGQRSVFYCPKCQK